MNPLSIYRQPFWQSSDLCTPYLALPRLLRWGAATYVGGACYRFSNSAPKMIRSQDERSQEEGGPLYPTVLHQNLPSST